MTFCMKEWSTDHLVHLERMAKTICIPRIDFAVSTIDTKLKNTKTDTIVKYQEGQYYKSNDVTQ